MKKQLTEGKVIVTSRGTGYVSYRDNDVEIESQYLKNAWSGDTVLVEIVGKKQNQYQGRVKKIVNRAHNKIVGIVTIDTAGRVYLIPDSRKIRKQINLITEKEQQPKGDQKAIVSITSWGNQFEHPEGTIDRVLGPKGNHEVEMESILFDKHSPGGIGWLQLNLPINSLRDERL